MEAVIAPNFSIDDIFDSVGTLTEKSQLFKANLKEYLIDALYDPKNGVLSILKRIQKLKRSKELLYSNLDSLEGKLSVSELDERYREIGRINLEVANKPFNEIESGRALPLFYHFSDEEYTHTMGYVVPNTIRILNNELIIGNISAREATMGVIAAAFHDVGFVKCLLEGDSKGYDGNEPKGVDFVIKYMEESEKRYTDGDKAIASIGIIYTDLFIGKAPTIVAGAIRDADLSYLGDENEGTFLAVERRLREEVYYRPHAGLFNATETAMKKLVKAYGLEDHDFTEYSTKKHRDLYLFAWNIISMNFMQNVHDWRTESAREMFETNKQKNVLFYDKQLMKAKEDFEAKYDLADKGVSLTNLFPKLYTKYQPS